MKSDKMQVFTDTRCGCSATLRIDFESDLPFVLRVRYADGTMFFKQAYETARSAKLALERIVCYGITTRGNWRTVKGNVCDIA